MIRHTAMAVLLLLSEPSAVHAQGAGSPRAGHQVAREICASCHAVEPGQYHSPRQQAPSFERIARVPGMTTTALTVALRTSHKTMPNIILEPKELRDVTTYITSLRERR
ncbi:c-type cytochrome [Microvirga sp. M2]|uniref:c-type cytochrome n=1 Tax=Microvirga sp. M2 TaxID=3073270 RepID=UPI0039C17458